MLTYSDSIANSRRDRLVGQNLRFGENVFLSTQFVVNSLVPTEVGFMVSRSRLREMCLLSLVCQLYFVLPLWPFI